MADTIVSVFNRALGACKVRASIASETENSSESRVCILWYDTILRQVLRAAPWPAASSYQRLARFATNEEETWGPAAPAPGYAYAYHLPSDMIWPRNLTTWEPFEISKVGSKKRLSCNNPEPVLNYTSHLTDITEWDSAFEMAIVFALASVICGKLTASSATGAKLEQQANDLILSARVSAANVDEESYESVPEWYVARGFGLRSGTRYIHPNGSLLQNTGTVNVA